MFLLGKFRLFLFFGGVFFYTGEHLKDSETIGNVLIRLG